MNGTHHHGPLAGIGTGAAAVLTAGVLILVIARRQLGMVATVAAWALSAVVIGAVIAAAVYAFLWLRHRVRHPETLAPRQAAQAAEVVPPAIGAAAEPLAIEPPRVYLNVTPDELAAILRRNAPGTAGDDDTERN